MNLPIFAITVGTIAQYVFSAMWYMPLFGKQWGVIHGFDQVTPEMQKDMQRSMMPLLVGQFVVTAITSVVFGVLVYLVGDKVSLYLLALLVWVGLVLPTHRLITKMGSCIIPRKRRRQITKSFLETPPNSVHAEAYS